jgi:hypothetical protein
MANSFHQFRLDDKTSELLSVVTPLGQFEPMFLPEGVKPASQILQRVVRDMFSDYLDWMIVIFDNFLVLANDYDDLHDKLQLALQRAVDWNCVLKFKKTFIGYTEVNFFGYLCKFQNYSLSDKRKEAISHVPFPNSVKSMQSFLGAANFSLHIFQGG